MALSRIVKTSSKLIHKGLVGNHSSRNVMMRIVNISLNQSSSRLGVAQVVKLTSPGVNLEDRGGFIIPNVLVGISWRR